MKKILIIIITILSLIPLSGCTVVSENTVFPKLKWYWSPEAKSQREYDRKEKAEIKAYKDKKNLTNTPVQKN